MIDINTRLKLLIWMNSKQWQLWGSWGETRDLGILIHTNGLSGCKCTQKISVVTHFSPPCLCLPASELYGTTCLVYTNTLVYNKIKWQQSCLSACFWILLSWFSSRAQFCVDTGWMHKEGDTADCKSLARKPAEQWKTTIDLPRMNLIIFPPQQALPLCSSPLFSLFVARLLQSAVDDWYCMALHVWFTQTHSKIKRQQSCLSACFWILLSWFYTALQYLWASMGSGCLMAHY